MSYSQAALNTLKAATPGLSALKPATQAELDKLAAQGFYAPEWVAERGDLPQDVIALRAGFYLIGFDADEADDRFEAWCAFTDEIGLEFDVHEGVDMALCFA